MRNRAVVLLIAGLGLIPALAACGGGVEGQAAALANSIQEAVKASQPTGGRQQPGAGTAATSTAADTAATTTTESAPPPVTRAVDKTGWYNGFAITVDEVTATQGFGDGVDVTASFSYQNLDTADGTPPEASIQVDGTVVEGFFDAPGIPGGGKAAGTATFTVRTDRGTATTYDEALDQVSFVYGDVADNQTTIPLAAAAAVTSVEPQTLSSAGTMNQGEIVIDVVGGTLVPSYESGEKGKTLLNLRVKLHCAAGCSPYGYNTNRPEFSVTGPDGNAVVADDRSEYCCDALYPEVVSDDERNILTFVLTSPQPGDYTLTYRNPSLTAGGTAPATFTFSI